MLNVSESACRYSLWMSDDTKIESGRRLRAAREAMNLTLGDIHARLPWLTVSRLSNWEQGIRMIGVDEAKKLAPVLNVTAAYILTLEDAPMDSKEQALIDLFRHLDERGKSTLIRVAETESTFRLEDQDVTLPNTKRA